MQSVFCLVTETPQKLAITDAKLHVLIVTLSIKDSEYLAKQLSKGFKRSIFSNSYHLSYWW